MSHLIYLTLEGDQQGLISSGCSRLILLAIVINLGMRIKFKS